MPGRRLGDHRLPPVHAADRPEQLFGVDVVEQEGPRSGEQGVGDAVTLLEVVRRSAAGGSASAVSWRVASTPFNTDIRTLMSTTSTAVERQGATASRPVAAVSTTAMSLALKTNHEGAPEQRLAVVDAAVEDALEQVRGRGRPSLSAAGESPLLRGACRVNWTRRYELPPSVRVLHAQRGCDAPSTRRCVAPAEEGVGERFQGLPFSRCGWPRTRWRASTTSPGARASG
ncbi:hypothetical protein [Pseudokineococcus sp. 1T1Z-3]|uniref:hypothetical protein n=1 Tax=Pseudokineococcus sp. 1T1Z-3 TaxID=3132745 RepID=UPI0030B47CA2